MDSGDRSAAGFYEEIVEKKFANTIFFLNVVMDASSKMMKNGWFKKILNGLLIL